MASFGTDSQVPGRRAPKASEVPKLERFREGLKECSAGCDDTGGVVGRTAGVMGIVEVGSPVPAGMNIVVDQAKKYKVLECV